MYGLQTIKRDALKVSDRAEIINRARFYSLKGQRGRIKGLVLNREGHTLAHKLGTGGKGECIWRSRCCGQEGNRAHTLQTCSVLPGGPQSSAKWEGVRVEHGWLVFQVGEEDELKMVTSLLQGSHLGL